MAEYVSAPIETDEAALAEDALAELQDRVPGWEPHPAHPETLVIEATARMAAEVRDVASDVPDTIFRHFGASLAGLPPEDGAPATVGSTWTAIDAAGYTIDEGTVVGVRAAGDDLVLFEVLDTITIAAGSTTTAAGAVTLVAQDDGTQANGLGGAGVAAELVDALAWVSAVTLTGATGGGVDPETDAEYLNRLAEELALQAPRPIVPRDFAVMAKRVDEVDRALALDLYKPADQPNPGDPVETTRERSVTVVPIREDGEPVSAAALAAVDALLEAAREVNFEVWTMNPTYTTVSVTFTATAYPGWDAADVEARAEAAVAAFLSPASWGLPPYSDERTWTNDTRVRHYELVEALNRVDGLWRVDSLSFGVQGGAQGTADLVMAGDAPLPRAGTIAGSVVAP